MSEATASDIGPVCKGSWALRTECGHCRRCVETFPRYLDDLRAKEDQFRRAQMLARGAAKVSLALQSAILAEIGGML